MERQRELDLTSKVVIITGASRGMGRQAARRPRAVNPVAIGSMQRQIVGCRSCGSVQVPQYVRYGPKLVGAGTA